MYHYNYTRIIVSIISVYGLLPHVRITKLHCYCKHSVLCIDHSKYIHVHCKSRTQCTCSAALGSLWRMAFPTSLSREVRAAAKAVLSLLSRTARSREGCANRRWEQRGCLHRMDTCSAVRPAESWGNSMWGKFMVYLSLSVLLASLSWETVWGNCLHSLPLSVPCTRSLYLICSCSEN